MAFGKLQQGIMEIIEIKEYSQVHHCAVQRLLDVLVPEPMVLSEAYFREIIASDNSHLLLLQTEGEVIGMVTVSLYKNPTGTKAWIEDVAIDTAHQGKGLGRFMMQHAISFAKSLGADALMLTSSPFRVAANNLYKSLGFEQRETNVYKILF